MPKIITFLPQSVITDFSGIFDSPQEERSFVYKNLVTTINKNLGDILIKRTCFITKIKNGKPEQEEKPLDEIGFETADIPINPEWRTSNVSGQLQAYEYPIGERLLVKLKKYCKLQWLINNIAKESLIEDLQKGFENTSDLSVDELNKKREMTEEQIQKVRKQIDEDCFEGHIYNLLSNIIFDKIKSEEEEALNKEQKELEKELEPPKEE